VNHFGATANGRDFVLVGIPHEHTETAIALENRIHHYSIAKLEDLQRQGSTWK
jgi:hypothetical protein